MNVLVKGEKAQVDRDPRYQEPLLGRRPCAASSFLHPVRVLPWSIRWNGSFQKVGAKSYRVVEKDGKKEDKQVFSLAPAVESKACQHEESVSAPAGGQEVGCPHHGQEEEKEEDGTEDHERFSRKLEVDSPKPGGHREAHGDKFAPVAGRGRRFSGTRLGMPYNESEPHQWPI